MKNQIFKNEITWKAIENEAQRKGMGFIAEFILYRTATHREPLRRGTPKGEKIGFSGKKYFATILVGVTNWKPKNIASRAEIPYGSLRAWKTEPDFNAESEKHRMVFAQEIISRAMNDVELRKKAFDDYYAGIGPDPLQQKGDTPLDSFERVLADAKHFNDDILGRLTAFSIALANAPANGFEQVIEKYALIHNIRQIISLSERGELVAHNPLMLKTLITQTKFLIDGKNTMTARERRMAIHNLKIVEDGLQFMHDKVEKGKVRPLKRRRKKTSDE